LLNPQPLDNQNDTKHGLKEDKTYPTPNPIAKNHTIFQGIAIDKKILLSEKKLITSK
jgi:hypothetical protein